MIFGLVFRNKLIANVHENLVFKKKNKFEAL